MKKLVIMIAAVVIITSCSESKKSSVMNISNADVLNSKVLTAAEQASLTPDKVIARLKKGNETFAGNKLTIRNNTALVADAANGQYPEAVILSCLDSRVPVEDVFNRSIGDVFVARVAGNIVNVDILGSMEFACAASGSKLILVLGHGKCGAIMHAIDGTELGNITEMLSKIQPAVAKAKSGFTGETTSANSEFVEHVCHVNVEEMVNEIRRSSPILRGMEEKGEIKIIGGWYDMYTGKVDFIENI